MSRIDRMRREEFFLFHPAYPAHPVFSLLDKLLSPGERTGERSAIDVFETAAHRHTEGKSRDCNILVCKLLFEKKSCRVPFESGVKSDDDLLYLVVCNPLLNPVEFQSGGMASIERGKKVLDDMIEPLIGMGLFNGIHIAGGRNDAEKGGVSIGRAEAASLIEIGEAAAGWTGWNLFLNLLQKSAESRDLIFRPSN